MLWYGGLRPSEEKEDEDVQYGSGIISQAGEIEDVQTKKPDEIRTVSNTAKPCLSENAGDTKRQN